MGSAPDAYVDQRARVQCEFRGDRFAHVIKINIDGQYRTVLESVEPTIGRESAVCWPPSPPLKDWHFERRARAAVFMAVGTAGKSHWSASIEIARDGAIRFDVAARLAAAPGFLGSQYQCPATCRLIDPTCLELLPDLLLCCDAMTTRMRLDEQSGVVIIEPLPITTTVWPQTIRWRYWV